MSSTIPDVMRVLCQPACFHFHPEPGRGSVSIPHTSHLAALALRYIYVHVDVCYFIAEVLQMNAGWPPVGITATQEADNQSPLARIASN